MNIKLEVEIILARELTDYEDRTFRFFWTKVFMNPFDLANKIKAAA
jgi:hypothetical protein